MQIFREALWTPHSGKAYRVISLHGAGGQGKTALLNAYRQQLSQCGNNDIPVATIDFDDIEQRSPSVALLRSRNALQKKGVRTHAFDIAFARHYALTRPGQNIRSDHPELFALESGLIGDLIDICGNVAMEAPGGKLLYQFLTRFGTSVINWYRRYGSDILRDLDELQPPEIRAEFPMFLGSDLRQHAAEHPEQRPVILVDGYESLWARHRGVVGSDAEDLWLRRLVEESPGCLFVIAGRRPVRWDRVDPEWGNCVQRVKIQPLDDENSEFLLEGAGVAEMTSRLRMRETAAGHPFSLALQVSTYWKIKARGRVPKPDDFASVQKDVIDRFMGHLDPSLQVAYQILAIPRHVDQHIWSHFQRAGIALSEQLGFEEIAEDVLFQGSDVETRTMHPLMKSYLVAQTERQNPELLRRVRLALFDYLDRASSIDPQRRTPFGIPDRSGSLIVRDACLSEAADVLTLCDPASFAEWCIRRFRGDLRGPTSRLRVSLLARAKKLAAGNVQKIALARLFAETAPFSGQAEELLNATLNNLELTDEIRKNVEIIGDCLSQGERNMPINLLEWLRKLLPPSSPLALRLALRAQDIDYINQQLLSCGGDQTTAFDSYDLVGAAAFVGNKDFALKVADQHLRGSPAEELTNRVSACRLASAFLLSARPAWALAVVERLLHTKEDLLLEAVERLDGTFAPHLKMLAMDALVSVGKAGAMSDYPPPAPQVELVVNERSEIFCFTDSPLLCWRDSDFVVVSRDSTQLWFSDPRTGLVNFGLPIDPRLSQHIGQGGRILFVLMNKNSGEPLAGGYKRAFSAEAVEISRIQDELVAARGFASNLFETAAVRRP